jgi:large subunit ribosomal protein L25
MELRKVSASPRTAGGKGAAGRLRNSGSIPAVAYGKNLPSRALAVSPVDLKSVLTSERGTNTVIELDIDSGKEKLTVLLCDSQHHPVTRALLHADFLQIALDQPVDVEIPLHVTGKPVGVVKGGVLRQVFRKLPVRCLPELIPVSITHDVTELDLDGHVPTKALALPEGVVARLPPEQTIIAIVTEKHQVEEEAAAAPGAAAGAPAAAGSPSKAPPAKADEKKSDKK